MSKVVATAPVSEDQDKLLSEAKKQVSKNGFEMKSSLDNKQLMDALKHASTMLSELRTSLLSPKSYYELYMYICDELQHLQQYLQEEFENGKKCSDLYELVQYAGNIIPRLYLLVTVGMVYIKANEGSRKDILRDLVEMCRGVQHPLRGLFLRNYLLQCTRNYLPDVLDMSDDRDGVVGDSIDFILQNFGEMNKLWVRMQHQGHTRERERREKERMELRILVGTNLVRLSQLESVDDTLYQGSILPNILEQVVKCRDPIAQEYLMECVIQVFPDEFHLQTLNPFLQSCANLQQTVNVKNIITALIDRLATFAHRGDGGGIPSDIKLFDIFSQEVSGVVNSRPDMALDDVVALYTSLSNLALKCYPDRMDFVDKSLQCVADIFKKRDAIPVSSSQTTHRELLKFVMVPVESLENPLSILKLEHISEVFNLFDYQGRKTLASHLVQAIVDKMVFVSTSDEVEELFQLLAPLIKDQPDQPEEEMDPEDFAEDQWLMGRLVQLFKGESNDQQYMILNTARKHFVNGGSKRIPHTLPALVFSAYRLVMNFKASQEEDERWLKKCERIFQFSLQTITGLAKEAPVMALRLFLQGALAADQVASETIAYEFVSQAYSLYEEDITDSRDQTSALTLIIGTFERLTCLGEDNHETLRTKCALTSSRLVKKADQTRYVALCAHLFWSTHYTNEEGTVVPFKESKRVVECLKKACRIAKQCMEETVQVQLYVDLINTFALFNEKGNEEVSHSALKQLVDKVREDIGSVEDESIRQHFDNTIAFLKKTLKLDV